MNIWLLKLNTKRLHHILPSVREIMLLAAANNAQVKLTCVPEGQGENVLLALECENEPQRISGCKWEEVKE